MEKLLRILLVALIAYIPAVLNADTTPPYSKPYHTHGRGWYPSIYWSTGRNLGSYFIPNENGQDFVLLRDDQWKSDTHALIYFYRPQSQWADEELEAPSYYINDEIIFNLRSGSYAWVQLPQGNFSVTARKSLMPLFGFESFDDKLMIAFDLNLLADFGMSLNPGEVYFIRHSEVSKPGQIHPDFGPDAEMAEWDVQIVTQEYAMTEIVNTKSMLPNFWAPNDAGIAEEVINETDIEYGWFSVIWPWSNNFLWGFPIWYKPSDMYIELQKMRGGLTIEDRLAMFEENPEAYIEEIQELRSKRRNWLAPWRPPSNFLTTNQELRLDKMERQIKARKVLGIKPKPKVEENVVEEDDDSPWWWPFGKKKEKSGPTLNEELQNGAAETPRT